MQAIPPGSYPNDKVANSIAAPGLPHPAAENTAPLHDPAQVQNMHTPGENPASAARALVALQAGLTRLINESDLDGLQAYLTYETGQLLGGEACVLVLVADPAGLPGATSLPTPLQPDGAGLDPGRSWLMSKTILDLRASPNQSAPQPYTNRVSSTTHFSSLQGPGLVKECLRTGKPVWSNNLPADARYDPHSDNPNNSGKQPTPQAMLCAPLLVNGLPLGVIQVINRRGNLFDDSSADLLSLAAVLAANAIQSVRLVQELKVASADLEASRWELLGSRNTLKALFDSLPFSLYIIDTQYRLAAVNKNRAQRAGQPTQALVGQLCYQALFERTTPCPECRVRETLVNGRPFHRSERRTAGQEDTIDWEIQAYPILDEEDQPLQAILLEQDNTERRDLEAILTQSEKLAAVGQLAAGVAHEINNPLTAIIANAQLLRRGLPSNSDLQESVDLIARAGGRAAQVVRNLLDFARKEEYRLGLTDLNETIERALELVQHELLEHGVRLQFDADPNLPLILASPDHLQSVWLNLLLNAIDSMDKTPAEIRIATRRVGSEIQVSVTDNGKGITPERLRRVFEPFYTTKAAGRGTGLGLSVSHRIVKQHNGSIRVESQVGMGSTFTVLLPAN